MHERFRAGVAAWVEAMPSPPVEYTLLDLRPEIPDAVGPWAAAFVYLSWGLSGNASEELMRAWIAERAGPEAARALVPSSPDSSAVPAFGALRGSVLDDTRRPGARGSNAWALSPALTATGGALLANDPHLEALQPGVWIEMHLSAPGYRARGVCLPWSPGIVLGTTAHHAWGATNVTGDVQDLFVEELSDDGTSVRRGEEWAPLIVHAETIEVRGADPVHLSVRETSHGPLIDRFPVGEGETEHVAADIGRPNTGLALAWTGLEHAIQPSLAIEAASASSFETFRAAVAGVTCPGQNFVYADVDGTIGSTCTGVYPVRLGGDGTVPTSAADGGFAWIGEVGADELPWAVDPARGWLVTANDRPHDERYPHLIGRDFHAPHRAGRIAQQLEAREDHDVASTAALQVDTISLIAIEVVSALAALEPRSDDQRTALELLASWDGDLAAGSTAALVFQVWSNHVAARRLRSLLGDDLFERYHADREVWHCRVLSAVVSDAGASEDVLAAFDDAFAELRDRLGADMSAVAMGGAAPAAPRPSSGRDPRPRATVHRCRRSDRRRRDDRRAGLVRCSARLRRRGDRVVAGRLRPRRPRPQRRCLTVGREREPGQPALERSVRALARRRGASIAVQRGRRGRSDRHRSRARTRRRSRGRRAGYHPWLRCPSRGAGRRSARPDTAPRPSRPNSGTGRAPDGTARC